MPTRELTFQLSDAQRADLLQDVLDSTEFDKAVTKAVREEMADILAMATSEKGNQRLLIQVWAGDGETKEDYKNFPLAELLREGVKGTDAATLRRWQVELLRLAAMVGKAAGDATV